MVLHNLISRRLFRPWLFAFLAAFLPLLFVWGVSTPAPPPVQAQTPTAGLTISPTQGTPGTSVTVNVSLGSSQCANSQLRLKIGDGPERAFSSAGSDGTYQARITIPDSPQGSLHITVRNNEVRRYTTAPPTPDADGVTPTPPVTCQASTKTATFTVQPEATMSPNSGSVGQNVQMSGKGFPASQNVAITFDGQDVRQVRTDVNGNLQGSVSFPVPPLSAGTYNVLAGDYFVDVFTITSELAVTPAQGPPGTSIRINGSGYAAGTAVSLDIDGRPLDPLRADAQGALTGAVQIPPISGGRKVITVSGAGVGSVQATFEVTPTLALQPSAVTPGDRVKVSGTAFRSNEPGITIRFDNTEVASGIVADANGVWSAEFTVPDTTSGGHTVTVSGASTRTNIPTLRLNVGSGMRLEKSGGPPGSPIVVIGSGVGAAERIAIDVGDGRVLTETTADTRGVWRAEIPAPAAPRGPLTVSASRLSGETDSVFYIISPRVEISAIQGQPGSTFTFSGQGFTGDKTGIPILFGAEILTAVNADSDGSWRANLTVPPVARGSYDVRVAGSGANLQVSFNVRPTLEVSVNQVSPGEALTVSGEAFSANETGISVTLGSTVVARDIGADASGSWTSTFRLPPIPAGSYSLTASGPRTGRGQAPSLSIKSGSRLTVAPTSGVPGSTVEVAGEGFAADDDDITVTYDGATVASGVKSDSGGEFTASFIVPLSGGGSHTIEAVASLQTTGSRAGFDVTPAISLGVDSGIAGDEVTLTGIGFEANDPGINILFGSAPLDDEIASDAHGSFEAVFPAPAAPAGKYAVTASGSNPNLAAADADSFEVHPNLIINNSAGPVGTAVQLRGTGFSADAVIAVAYGFLVEETVESDRAGSFLWRFDVPVSKGGQHTISAQDNQGNRFQLPFDVETDAPVAPVLTLPENGIRSGFFGGFQPITRWDSVDDPSGVTYNLQVAADPDFFDIVLEQTGLTDPNYPFTEEQALERGAYYWRVQAVDRASNAGPYSEVFEMQSGLIPVWLFSAIVLFALLVSGGGAYAYRTKVYLPRKMLRESPAFPEFIRVSRPELPSAGPGPAQAPSSAPPALPALAPPPPGQMPNAPQQPAGQMPGMPQQAPGQAQPAPPQQQRPSPSLFRGRGGSSGGGVPPGQQVRFQLVVDFVRSIPLLDVAPDLRWVEELIEPYGGPSPYVYQQVLDGDLEPTYQPAWLQHPTYQQLEGEPSARAFLDGLDAYIAAVNDCAAYTLVILTHIHRNLEAASPPGQIVENQWPFVLSVAQSAVAWFRGTHLAQPSVRDYIIAPVAEGSPLSSLYGDANSPFPGLIVESMNEAGLLFHRDLHIQLRNAYRTDEEARALAAKMVSINALADQLQRNISQASR